MFFDENALSVVDSWLEGVSDEKVTPSEVKNRNANKQDALKIETSKSGLGYSGAPKVLKEKDALTIRLEKQKKKNAKSTKTDDVDPSHGLIEDYDDLQTQRFGMKRKEKETKMKHHSQDTEVAESDQTDPDASLKIISENEEDKPKRKRQKTRSKQKNIRRDNRPDNEKPEHLRLGSGAYKGRPLTQATKQVLQPQVSK